MLQLLPAFRRSSAGISVHLLVYQQPPSVLLRAVVSVAGWPYGPGEGSTDSVSPVPLTCFIVQGASAVRFRPWPPQFKQLQTVRSGFWVELVPIRPAVVVSGLSRRSFGFSECCTRDRGQPNAQPLHPKLKCGALDSQTSSRSARSANNPV